MGFARYRWIRHFCFLFLPHTPFSAGVIYPAMTRPLRLTQLSPATVLARNKQVECFVFHSVVVFRDSDGFGIRCLILPL